MILCRLRDRLAPRKPFRLTQPSIEYSLSMRKKALQSAILTKKRVFMMPKNLPFTPEQIEKAKAWAASTPPDDIDPRVEVLVNDLIGRVADKWTMLILEELVEGGELRFSRLSALLPGISQKMLTQTLRGMERDGLVTRTVHLVVPPKVEYKLTPLGLSLGAAFCCVWVWAEANLQDVECARAQFDDKSRRAAK